MATPRIVLRLLLAGVVLAGLAPGARGDELRNLKKGEPLPAYRLPTIDEKVADSEEMKGSVVVLVYLSAEQRSSELAAMDSRDVMKQFAGEPVRLVHLTADLVQKPYFQRFRQERALDVPLAFDPDRGLYGKLGLIVFPTTIVVSKEGKLAHVISLRGADYAQVLEAYVRHALGQLDDQQLKERLAARGAGEGSPKSLASSHRAVARFHRDKGRLDAAKEELLKANELDPANPDILIDLADTCLAMGDLDEAERLTAATLQAHPGNRRARQLQGIALYRRGKYDEAKAALEEALQLNPDPSRVHYYLGMIFEREGDTAKALEHYREALRRVLHEPDRPPGEEAAPSK